MLEYIRERAHGWFAWIAMGFLVVTFGAWGINYYFENMNEVNVAKVNGESISATEFQRLYQQRRTALMARNSAPIDDVKLKQDVLDRLIERRLLLQSVSESGYRVSDHQLSAMIRSIPELQRGDRFDPELYNQLVRAQGETVKSFENIVREDMVINQIQQGFVATDFVVPREIAETIRLRDQRRDIGYLTLPAAHYMEAASPKTEDISKYYEDHRNQYAVPEQVSVDYLELSADQLAQHVQATDAELRQSYEQRTTDFATPEERRVRHILIQVAKNADKATVEAARKRAEAALARTRKGESFDVLAGKLSEDPGSAKSGGDLGYFGHGVMDPAFEAAAFSLGKGQISDVVRSSFGFHVLKVEDIRAGQRKNYESVRDEVARDYRKQKAEERYFDLAEKLSNQAFEHPDTLQSAAAVLGLSVQSTALFSRDGGVGIAGDAKVRAAAFSDDVLAGNNSEAIEVSPNHVVVLRVHEHRPAATRSLGDVRAEVERALRQINAAAQAKAAGEALIERARKGEEITALGMDWKRAGYVHRNDAAAVNPEVLKAAFRAPHPQGSKPSLMGVALSTGDYVVVGVYGVKDGDIAAADEATRASIRQGLQAVLPQVRFQSYTEELKQRAKIERYPQNL